MVIDQLLSEGIKSLQDKEYTNPQLEVRLILSRLMDVDKSYLYAYGDKEVSHDLVRRFRKMIQKRTEGYPLQYLLGTQEFMGMELEVSEGVLIPRGDTEILVDHLRKHIEKTFDGGEFTLLDIGVGSGAISLAIAKLFPNARVYGVDLYEKPIQVANRNRERLGLENVDYYLGDLFSPFLGEEWRDFFDIIVSNPPYIPEADREGLQVEVGRYEPETALFAGEDGLDFYRRITAQAKGYLRAKGLLAYEIGHDQGREVADILRKQGFNQIEIIDDFENRNRVVTGRA